MTLVAVAIFVVSYVLIATERVHRVAAALGGAAAMAALGIVDADEMFFSRDTGVDWNVVFLLLGMMVIVAVLRPTGLFEYVAIWAAKRARGRPFRVLALLVLVTTGASALLDNVTTVLLIAPVTLLVCDRLAVPPAPYLIAEAMASNIGGTATLVGDPPNIIIASRGGLSFNDFLLHLTPLVLVLLAVFVALSRWLFRDAFRAHPDRIAAVMALEEGELIRDRALLARCLAVLAAVVLGFVLHTVLRVEPSVVALLGAGGIVLVARAEPQDYLRDVEWPTLAFFMGLFVMVGGLVQTGVIARLGTAATEAVGDRFLVAATALLFGSAVLSAIVDNIPCVATMAPLVADLVAHAPDPRTGQALWWALALGADLGGNATAVGASANVIVTGLAARNGVPISFWEFTRTGLVVAAVTVALSWPYLWLRYFVF
ncbi:MAG TPA: ArsB/NhaD family transporter [Mycobacteriales bacterium]|nr:ArsB/NhaD family transporter [Mycobacteriales bacterium]